MKLNKFIYLLLLLAIKFNLEAQINYNMFKGEKVKTSLEVDLDDAYFKQYGNDFMKEYEEISFKNDGIDCSTPENLLVSYYSVSSIYNYNNLFVKKPIATIRKDILFNRMSNDSLKTKIRLIHRLTFTFRDSQVAFLKYYTIQKNATVVENVNVLEIQSKANKNWKINEVKELSAIKECVRILKTETFWLFMDGENNPKYPEINKLKPMVKDANGVLNIEKLAQVIKKNKASLSKYLDE